MISFRTTQSSLQQALSAVQRVVPSKPQLPILGSILCEVSDELVTFYATDLYTGIAAKISATQTNNGRFTIPARALRELVQNLQQGEVVCEYADTTLTLVSGSTKATIQCQNADEYPPFPQVEGKKIVVSSEILDSIVKYVAFSASLDPTRPILTSVNVVLSDEVVVVATDGFRLSILSLGSVLTEGNEHSALLIPAKSLLEIDRLVQQAGVTEVSWTISLEQKQILFEVNDMLIFIRLIEGEFPPYQKIIPPSFLYKIHFDTAELTAALKRASTFAKESSNIIRLEVLEGVVSVKAVSPTLGEFNETLQHATLPTPPVEMVTIACNSRYIQDVLSVAKEEEVVLSFNESLKPIQLTISSITGFTYIVMPFKVS
jgi:DNA polymerase-3 subunit beta